MAVVMLSPGMPWPVWIVAFLCFVFALVVMAQDQPARRRLTCGVLFSVLLVGGPAVVTISAASVGGSICQWLPFLLECWFAR